MSQTWWQSRHISVLLDELVNAIEVYQGRQNIIVDCTLWMAGHGKEIIKKMWKWDIFIWFDADARNLNLVKEELNSLATEVEIILINANFIELRTQLEKIWINQITWIYYDLGISSLHVDEWERWFSFKNDWPLDMRFDISFGKTAADIINFSSKEELEEIFKNYWEYPGFRKIADRVLTRRKEKKFTTTLEFADFLDDISNYPKTKTQIFQSLRIAVNNELQAVEDSLRDAIALTGENGNLFVISFHSLEDRIVKQIFKRETRDCICQDIICQCWHKKSLKLMNKKPILPSQEEISSNSRSRSAKARHAKKII